MGRKKKAPVAPPRDPPTTGLSPRRGAGEGGFGTPGGDLLDEPVVTAGEEPESAAPSRGEPPRESDETF